MKYKEWLEIWLDDYVVPYCKFRTCERYRQIVRNHILPKLGECEIKRLTLDKLQHFVRDLMDGGSLKSSGGLSSNTVNGIISVVQNSLKTAHTLGVVNDYIAGGIIRPKRDERKVSCFTEKEQRKIEDACLGGKRRLLGIVICLYTGLRIGELLALKFSDVDFKRSLLFVTKTCYDVAGGRVIDKPKTQSSQRVIPLPKQICDLIKKLKSSAESDYIIAEHQKPTMVRSYQRTFERLLKKIGVPHKGFHALRHTFATRALECGMDIKTLSDILGHKNATITLNCYVHSLLEYKVSMMNKVAKNLHKKIHQIC